MIVAIDMGYGGSNPAVAVAVAVAISCEALRPIQIQRQLFDLGSVWGLGNEDL